MSDRTPGVSRGIGTPGATPVEDGINFAVVSEHADRVDVCLFDDQGERERLRLPLTRISDGMFAGLVHGIGVGAHYGFRADGPHDPQQGHWFDPAKLLSLINEDQGTFELEGNIIRDAEVTDAVPQKNCATTAISSRNSAQALPSDVVQM